MRRATTLTVVYATAIGLAVGTAFTVRAYKQEQTKISAARHALDGSRAREAQLHGQLDSAHTATKTALQRAAEHQHSTQNELASIRRILTLGAAAAQAKGAAQNTLKVSTIARAALGLSAKQAQACMSAEQTAMQHIRTANRSAAAADLNSGALACSTALAGASGARFPYDFPDPSMLTVGGRYYAFSTNAGAGDVQVITSTNLVDWALAGNALAELPPWAKAGSTWAPSVVHLAAVPAQPASAGTPAVAARPDAYVMYYTTRDAASGDECVSSAVSALPAGPYFDRTQSPLVCQASDGGSIDPSPFADSDGTVWLLWKRERAVQPATLQIQRLSSNGRALTGPSFDLLQSDRAWQHGVVEAPSMVHTSAGYILFFAGGVWSGATYGTGVARCDTPIGPCHEQSSPVMSSTNTVIGPGGAEVFTDRNGALWLAYASYVNPFVGWPYSRTLRLARVTIGARGVSVTPA